MPTLQIKNWNKYQSIQKGRSAPWFKVYSSALDDEKFLSWSPYKRGIWVSLLMLRARSGKDLEVTRNERGINMGKTPGLLGLNARDAQGLHRVVMELTSEGFLVLSNQQNNPENSSTEIEREREIEGEGEGEGEVDVEEKTTHPTHSKKEPMSARKRIEEISLKTLGIVPRDADFRGIQKNERLYKSGPLVDAFNLWAESVKNDGVRPQFSDFFRHIPDFLNRGRTEVTTRYANDSDFDEFFKALLSISGNEVTFNNLQELSINNLISDFGVKDVIAAYRDFYGKLDDYTKRFADKDFPEKAVYYIKNIRIEREKTEAHQKEMDRIIMEGRIRAEVDMAELKKKEEEDQSMVESELKDD